MTLLRRLPIAAAITIIATFGPPAEANMPTGGRVGDERISLLYNPTTGNLFVDAAGLRWSTLELLSESGLFDQRKLAPDLMMGLWPDFNPHKLFLLKPAGFGDTNLGDVLPPGLQLDQLAADLTATGAILPRGSINESPHGPVDLGFVPEPSGATLLGCGLLGLGLRRRTPSARTRE